MLVVRSAQPREAERLTSIAFLAKSHWRYPPQAIRTWRRALTVTPGAIGRAPTYVAQMKREILGFTMVSLSRHGAELEHLWVLPAYVGRGIGRLLLTKAANVARARGMAQLQIDADPNAEAFYRACGAIRIGAIAAPIAGKPARVRPLLTLPLTRSLAASN